MKFLRDFFQSEIAVQEEIRRKSKSRRVNNWKIPNSCRAMHAHKSFPAACKCEQSIKLQSGEIAANGRRDRHVEEGL